MYHQNGGSFPADMAGLATIPGLSGDQGGGLVQTIDMDMMGMDLVDPDSQNSTSFTSFPTSQQHLQQPQQQQQIQPDLSAETTNDAFPLVQDPSLTGAGAGPLPTGFGAPNMNPTGSTLTEFTKRRNWSQRVLEELRDFLHILTPDGRIVYVSPSCQTLTGFDSSQLVGRFIVEFIHPDDSGLFVKEFNESIASHNPLRFFYRFRKQDDSWIIFEAHGHPHISNEPAPPYLPPTTNCRGFFMMSRPYPTKNAGLLDSFLEHKIENERLMKRIADLKREEQEELGADGSQWSKPKEGLSSVTRSETQAYTESDGQSAAYIAMPPPAKPAVSNTALTRQNLDEALAASKPDSINDKMARYEGATHLETLEMLTGLRYRDGERSQGISTGDASPLLIRGDAGIQISIDRDGRSSSDKKKKLKMADEYVCTDCGTLDSPEWRKGPSGPKTLCNACGLRWAKKEKKKQGSSGVASHPPGLPMQTSTNSS